LRARSAFKLLQLDEGFRFLESSQAPAEVRELGVVDLCAAPGGWTQVAAAMLLKYEASRVLAASNDGETKGARLGIPLVAVDLRAMIPLDGAVMLQGDITRAQTAEAVIRELGGRRARLVLCDGAPDVTHLHDSDEWVQHNLTLAALNMATALLARGGTFVCKVFRGREILRLLRHLRVFFARVSIGKPRASRNSSLEGFAVCEGFSPPEGFVTNLSLPMELIVAPTGRAGDAVATSAMECDGDGAEEEEEEEEGAEDERPPEFAFLACGRSEIDADMAYSLHEPVVEESDRDLFTPLLSSAQQLGVASILLDPLAPPIDPPYRRALAQHRASSTGGGKRGAGADNEDSDGRPRDAKRRVARADGVGQLQ
jgi:23S rRNA U2552 (ribose-2'-O)-methylase RlmE/FtsJ